MLRIEVWFGCFRFEFVVDLISIRMIVRKHRIDLGEIDVRIFEGHIALRTSADFRAHDSMNAPQLRKGGTSLMRYEFDQLNRAMIGTLQDCLLSAVPR